MSYADALKAAGAEVLDYKEFGDWEGTWYAKVAYQGRTLLIKDYFGSCSGCDAFLADLGYDDKVWSDEEGRFVTDPTYPARLAAFGRKYLELPTDPARERASRAEDAEWDLDGKAVLAWLDEHFPGGAS